LRYLDSAAFGLYPIRSIGHALTILGQRETQKWVALVTAVMLAKDVNRTGEYGLVRARFCELMLGVGRTEHRLLFNGLLSLMDVLLSQPMSAVLAQLPISSSAAPPWKAREFIEQNTATHGGCERGEWGLLSLQCST